MAKKSDSIGPSAGQGRLWLQPLALRLTRIHFLYILAFICATIAFDTWNLYTHEAVAELWTAAGVFLVVNAVLWYASRRSFKSGAVYSALIWILILADIVFAAYNVNWQEGLASKSVALFAIPIVTAAVFKSRSAILTTAILSVAAYSSVVVRYFFINYGEGYRVELWGTVGFYSAIFLILALLLVVTTNSSSKS